MQRGNTSQLTLRIVHEKMLNGCWTVGLFLQAGIYEKKAKA